MDLEISQNGLNRPSADITGTDEVINRRHVMTIEEKRKATLIVIEKMKQAIKEVRVQLVDLSYEIGEIKDITL